MFVYEGDYIIFKVGYVEFGEVGFKWNFGLIFVGFVCSDFWFRFEVYVICENLFESDGGKS